ncbi:MAG: thioesterase family protein [Desulfofustis sp.]|nr:thioesterase family protein [Desulfofustis sp.]
MSCPSNVIQIKPEWIDHNDHLNVAYFVLAFDFATDAVYEEWTIGLKYQEQTGFSVFTLGMNVDYHKELFADDQVEVKTKLLDWDHKRIHYFHTMFHVGTGALAATNECLAMNIDLGVKKSASFPPEVQQLLADIHKQHAPLKLPQNCGRRLAIERKTPA